MEKILFCLFGLLAISKGIFTKKGFHLCGGSIITSNYVITAAHCIEDFSSDPFSITIVAGTVFYKYPYQIRQSTKFIIHEGYSPRQTFRNDIALIKVDTPFEYSELVLPVPLPDSHAEIPAKTAAVVSGWGSLSADSDEREEQLQEAQIWIADQNYCVAVMKKHNYTIYPTHICANDPNTRRGQCNGDAGGPLTVDGKLVGVLSWSIKDPDCASMKYPGVYTRVPEYMDWIIDHIFN